MNCDSKDKHSKKCTLSHVPTFIITSQIRQIRGRVKNSKTWISWQRNIFFLGNKKNYYVPHMTHFEKLSLCSGGNLSANLSHLIIFFPLKSSENLWLSVDFRGNTISLVPLNCLSIRSKIWRLYLIFNLTQTRFKEMNFFFCII